MFSTFKGLSNNIVVDKIKEEENDFLVHIHLKNKSCDCPKCNKPTTSIHSLHPRKIQDYPIQHKTVYLVLEARHFFCRKCKCIFTEELDFAENRSHKTKRLVNYILDKASNTSSIVASALLKEEGIMVKKSAICTYQKKR